MLLIVWGALQYFDQLFTIKRVPNQTCNNNDDNQYDNNNGTIDLLKFNTIKKIMFGLYSMSLYVLLSDVCL